MRRSATILTLRISFTCDVRAAWGPPLPMAAEISSLYILRRTQRLVRTHMQNACAIRLCSLPQTRR